MLSLICWQNFMFVTFVRLQLKLSIIINCSFVLNHFHSNSLILPSLYVDDLALQSNMFAVITGKQQVDSEAKPLLCIISGSPHILSVYMFNVVCA